MVIRGSRAVVIGVLIVALGGCGTSESRAENDARRLVSEELTKLEIGLSASFPEFDPVVDAERVSTWVPGTFAHAIKDNQLTIEFGVRRTGRDNSTPGETTVEGGACFRIVGDTSGGSIGQIACPEDFLHKPGQPVEVEVKIIDEKRPLKTTGN